MTHAASVTRGAASLLSSRFIVAGIALVFLGVSTRLLTLEEMAVFALYNAMCGILTVVCSLGLLACCVKLLPGMRASGRRAEAAGLLRVSVAVYLAGASAVTLILIASAGSLSRIFIKSPDFRADIRVAAGAALCYGLYEASQLMLSGLQQFGRLGAFNVSAALTQRVLSLGLFFALGLRGYLIGFAAGSLLGALLGLSVIAPHMRGPAEGGAGRIRYAFPFYVDGFLRYFYMHADQVLVGIFLSPASLSMYFVAKRFIQYCQVLISSLVDPLGAKVAQLKAIDPGAVRRAYSASVRYFIVIFVPLSLLLASTSPFLLAVVGGERYAGAAIPLALLFLSLPLFAMFSLMSSFIFILGRPGDRLVNNLVSTTAQAGALAALMPLLALPGLALARILGFGAATLYSRARARSYVRPGKVRPLGGLAMSSTAASLLMAAMIVVPHALVDRPLLIPLYAAPAGVLCAFLHTRFILAPEDRSGLASLLPDSGGAMGRVKRVLLGRDASDAAPPAI